MTEVNPPGFLQNAGNVHTAEILRSAHSGLLHGVKTAAGLVARGGVVSGMGGNLAVTQNGSPNMSVNVAAGHAYVPGTEGSKQGTYVVVNDASKNLTITAADGTNPRIDLIVAKVQDTLYSGAVNSWSLAVVAGTPAGSPAVPTQPANSIALAQVLVGAGVTSIVTGNITDRRYYAAALGGVIPCTSTDRPSITTVPNGTLIFETDTNLLRMLVVSSYILASPFRQVNVLGSAAATVTFSGIPSSLNRVTLTWSVRGDAASSGVMLGRVNGDSGANYRSQIFNNFATSTNASASIGQTSWTLCSFPFGSGTGEWNGGELTLMGWHAPHANYLTGISQSGYIFNTSGGSQSLYQAVAYLGSSGSGYTSLTLTQTSGNFQAGSSFAIEGWD
jgi:hypothetical protein